MGNLNMTKKKFSRIFVCKQNLYWVYVFILFKQYTNNSFLAVQNNVRLFFSGKNAEMGRKK